MTLKIQNMHKIKTAKAMATEQKIVNEVGTNVAMSVPARLQKVILDDAAFGPVCDKHYGECGGSDGGDKLAAALDAVKKEVRGGGAIDASQALASCAAADFTKCVWFGVLPLLSSRATRTPQPYTAARISPPPPSLSPSPLLAGTAKPCSSER